MRKLIVSNLSETRLRIGSMGTELAGAPITWSRWPGGGASRQSLALGRQGS